MTTTNLLASTAWIKVAETTDADLLLTWNSPVSVEVATTATDTAPTVSGHQLTRDSAITRAVLGTGYVWVRVLDKVPGQVTLIVSK